MKRFLVFVGIIALIGVAILGWYATRPGPLAFAKGKSVALASYSGHPTGVPADFTDADPLARGRYLTQAADCQACHTTPGGKPFAGGVAFKTPMGTLYSPNITPDSTTGIGSWSDAEFLSALHQGVGKDGKKLYPALPYAAYTFMTDEDALAIKAYLFSLQPVQYTPPPNELKFPFNQRALMSVWAGLFNPNERFKPVGDQSPEWNRGAYLVEALGHCGDCHTPRNSLQALNNSRKFSGATTQGWRAYNITTDQASGVGTWTDDELASFLSNGHAAGRGSASGPMGEAVDFSLSRLTASDIHSIVTYLKSVPAKSTPDLPAPKTAAAPGDPKQGMPADANSPRGELVFAGACASCHSWTGVSPISSQATLTGTRAINDPTATNVAQMVLNGTKITPHNGGLAMPGFGAAYNDEEVAAVANYVTARFGVKGATLTAEDVRKLRQQSS